MKFSTVEFYFKVLTCTLWFFSISAIVAFISLFRPLNPANGNMWCRYLTFGFRWITGIECVIHNKDRIFDYQPCVYLGNHQSNLDVIIHAHTFRTNTIGVGKKEIAFIPIFGTLFYLAGNILLDRTNRENAFASLDKIIERIKLKKVSVYLFPEGTRNHGAKDLLPFKKGSFYVAIKAQIPLVPIVASPEYKLIDFKNKKITKGTIQMYVLDPIPTVGKTMSDVDTLIKQTHEAMQKAFDNSITVVGKSKN